MHELDEEGVKKLIEAAKEVGYSVRPYSGRYMHGKSCIGFVADSESEFQMALEVVRALGNICDSKEELSDIVDILCDADIRTDSMGLGYVTYFPRILWPEGMTADEDE